MNTSPYGKMNTSSRGLKGQTNLFQANDDFFSKKKCTFVTAAKEYLANETISYAPPYGI